MKTDIFLISHSLMDLDSFIRRGTQYLYEVRNSKYTNIWENSIMRGLKWPVQFFIVYGYEFGETKASDKWHYPTDKQIFSCYDSFSHSSKLAYFKDEDDHESSDTGVNFWYNFKRFMSQFSFLLSMLFSIALGCSVAGYFYYKKFYSPSFDSPKSASVVKTENQKPSAPVVEKKGEEVKKPKITMITGDRLVYSDGLTIKKGSMFNGFKVDSISADICVLSNDSKQFRVATSGLRE
jgi:hypothetical protein